jgi:type VI secretion system secreted protein VgrG
MAANDRSDYRVEILCPDLSSELTLERGIAQERLGALFEINLSVYSKDQEIDLASVLGKPMAVHVKTATEERFFHGIVCHFAMVGLDDTYGHYQVVLRPQLWLLGEAAGCRVFENLSVNQILQDTFANHGVQTGTIASSPVRFEHCVQYRETDLYFATRLMERWGMYFFHEHEEQKHVLNVASGLAGHANVGEFTFSWDGAASDEYQITDWRMTSTLRSSAYKVGGTQHLTRQKVSAEEKTRFAVQGAAKLQLDDFEAVNEYEKPHLEQLAKARMQAIDVGVEEYTGTCKSPKIAVGALFSMVGHPRAEQNREYLIVAATYQFEGKAPGNDDAVVDPYVVTFTAIDSKTPFSPPVTTKKPIVQGPHLATVVEETDENGRVKVDFHWGGPDDSVQSCWARVSQNWAGKEWGGVFMPHIGHEVVVEFLDGDPDQPIVTGRVYNKENMPPLSLPGDKEKSIIRDHGGNEIMMDGTSGAQRIHIYCPSHESEIWLGKSIELKSVSNWVNEFLGFKEEKITGKATVSIGNDHTESVGGNKEETIVGKCKVKVGADVLEALLGAQHRTIVGLTSLFVGGAKKETIVGAEIKKVNGVKCETINGAVIKRGKSSEVKTFPEAFTKVKEVYKQKATDLVQEVKTSIKATCDHYKIGAKMLAQDVEDLAVKAKKEIVHQGKTVKLMAETAWQVESAKAKHEIAKWAMFAKLTVNDGNLEVKK